MSKERKNVREAMKKPALTLKEKRAAKKSKKDSRPAFLASEKR
jgi:hypothetical protein